MEVADLTLPASIEATEGLPIPAEDSANKDETQKETKVGQVKKSIGRARVVGTQIF